MPGRIKTPEPETMIALLGDVQAYALDFIEEYPLYRRIKLICERPIFNNRRTAYLYWIVHLARFRRGGDITHISASKPELLEYLTRECAEQFDLKYLKGMVDLDAAELDALICAEITKYGGERPAKTLKDLM